MSRILVGFFFFFHFLFALVLQYCLGNTFRKNKWWLTIIQTIGITFFEFYYVTGIMVNALQILPIILPITAYDKLEV